MTDYLCFEIGVDALGIITIAIEIPHDSSNKYEHRKKRHRFKIDRTLYSTGHFPTDYNFIPQTWGDHGNPRNVLLIGELSTFSDCVHDAPSIGPCPMIDPGRATNSLHMPREVSPHRSTTEYSVASHIA